MVFTGVAELEDLTHDRVGREVCLIDQRAWIHDGESNSSSWPPSLFGHLINYPSVFSVCCSLLGLICQGLGCE